MLPKFSPGTGQPECYFFVPILRDLLELLLGDTRLRCDHRDAGEKRLNASHVLRWIQKASSVEVSHSGLDISDDDCMWIIRFSDHSEIILFSPLLCGIKPVVNWPQGPKN